jgi:hypothetical protein
MIRKLARQHHALTMALTFKNRIIEVSKVGDGLTNEAIWITLTVEPQ